MLSMLKDVMLSETKCRFISHQQSHIAQWRKWLASW